MRVQPSERGAWKAQTAGLPVAATHRLRTVVVLAQDNRALVVTLSHALAQCTSLLFEVTHWLTNKIGYFNSIDYSIILYFSTRYVQCEI